MFAAALLFIDKVMQFHDNSTKRDENPKYSKEENNIKP
jgi:hypothetical protein